MQVMASLSHYIEISIAAPDRTQRDGRRTTARAEPGLKAAMM